MNILAIDCCLKLTGTALMLNNIIDFEQEDLGRRQSSELPNMTERLLQRNNISWEAINYIALTNGPGYFTGIRVGAAYVLGLAYACNVKVIPVSSLELLHYTFDPSCEDKKILALIYAGHGFVYASCKNFLEPGEYSHDEIISWCRQNPDAKLISDFPERIDMHELKILHVKPSMKSLCELAGKKINLAIKPEALKISYYRAPQGVVI